jgi:hypothetical protein
MKPNKYLDPELDSNLFTVSFEKSKLKMAYGHKRTRQNRDNRDNRDNRANRENGRRPRRYLAYED